MLIVYVTFGIVLVVAGKLSDILITRHSLNGYIKYVLRVLPFILALILSNTLLNGIGNGEISMGGQFFIFIFVVVFLLLLLSPFYFIGVLLKKIKDHKK